MSTEEADAASLEETIAGHEWQQLFLIATLEANCCLEGTPKEFNGKPGMLITKATKLVALVPTVSYQKRNLAKALTDAFSAVGVDVTDSKAIVAQEDGIWVSREAISQWLGQADWQVKNNRCSYSEAPAVNTFMTVFHNSLSIVDRTR